MKDDDKAVGLMILLFAGIPGMIAISAILNGWILTKLWLWFIVPLFDLGPLRIPYAIGLSIVVSFLTHQIDTTKSENKMSAGQQFGMVIMRPFMILLVAYIVKLFI